MTLHRRRPLPSPLIRVGKGSAPVPPVPQKALRPQGAAVEARLVATSGSSSAAAAEGPQQAATAAETTPKEAGAAAKEGEAAASRSEEEAVHMAGEALVQAGLKLVDAGEALVLAGQALRTTQPIMAQLQPQPQCDNHSHQPQQPALPASAAVSLAPVPKHQLQKPKCGIPLEWGT